MPKDKDRSYNSYYPVATLSNETCMFMTGYHKTLTQFFGWGKVWSIERGNKFDCVDIQFGFDRKIRNVVVYHNQARRQLLTLKRGQYCLVAGQARSRLKYNEKIKKHYAEWLLIAYMVQGMFVPTMFDVKKHDKDVSEGIEEEQSVEMIENKEKYLDNVVNEIFGEEIEADYEVDDIDDVFNEVKRRKK